MDLDQGPARAAGRRRHLGSLHDGLTDASSAGLRETRPWS
jgi:hypothetical protein